MTYQTTPKKIYRVTQPEWSKHAVIYQVNTRQFSVSGTFKEVTNSLSHICDLGADILWLMPIHPIGEKNRKGELGSPYAVKDYLGINPEFGNADDVKELVQEAHKRNLKVILDWVPNHSAWDNPLVDTHPHWYARDHHGEFRPSPWWDWSDIIEFDYDEPALREYMINAMRYWVERFDIDGFRCDVAGYVPNDFWHQARVALDAIKPVFMLAEWENRDLHETAFNMTYAWSWNETMHELAHGRCSLDRLRKYYSWNERAWPHSAYRMTFVSNHDKNAWDGTQREQFGNALEGAIVLSVLGEGMPLIHNGQEAGETKRLAFFERDPIEWQPHCIGDLYRALIKIKKSIPALGNGEFGARMIQVPSNCMSQVFSFVRMDEHNKVLVIINFSSSQCNVTFNDPILNGTYSKCTLDSNTSHPELISEPEHLHIEKPVQIGSWGYQVWISAH
ncbi:alpha-amylase [Alteromonas sp. MMG017]|uniref:alpha-amylase family glycosyl hydrolase n=1 Tax=Alteromonas sp. MMG017 TaxID=2822692 RepID=UPI001B3A24D1|nr:alpha-amylase family glycosyl hydrolase [Alteromonas sp. MMG017]MBQ4831413.1 alpha-amylase [Alteromonas sp. MMG017]